MTQSTDGLPGLVAFLERKWFTKSGLAAALIASELVVGGLLATGGPGVIGTLSTLTITAATVCIAWWASTRPPRTKPDRIGFLVAIQSENDEESQRLKADFVAPLRKLIKSGATGTLFQFIELPTHLTDQVVDDEDAARMRIACKAHFMIFGRVRVRTIDGVPNHVIELDGAVAHKATSEHISHQLAKEFAELLPRRVRITSDVELFGFNFTSEWTEIVARYIIGIAAAISGDLVFAETLYTEAKNRLNSKNERFPIFQKLKERLPERLAEIQTARANAEYELWKVDHDATRFTEIGRHLEAATAAKGTLPGQLRFLAAIHAFVAHDDVQKAFTHLREVKDPHDAVWHYNMAFLNGYAGKLKQASQLYRNGSMFDCAPELLADIESFMCHILDARPDKYQIHFCLGLFNWRVKGDYERACADFRNFLTTGPSTEFSAERQLVPTWITRLEQENMGTGEVSPKRTSKGQPKH